MTHNASLRSPLHYDKFIFLNGLNLNSISYISYKCKRIHKFLKEVINTGTDINQINRYKLTI